MAILTVNGLKKVFIERLLFDDVSFEVAERDRIGLVGVNGSGKTTLFRILLGTEKADEGSVMFRRGLKVASMDQTISKEGTLYEATLSVFAPLIKLEAELDAVRSQLEAGTGDMGDIEDMGKLLSREAALREQFEAQDGLVYRSRTRSALIGLGFTQDELEKPMASMSGGQRNKAQLARMLLSGAELLLLDEPTNHLDLTAIGWLESFLLEYRGAFIVISHDRYFLDKVTKRTIELKNQHITVSEGNYSRHIELVADEQEAIRRKYLRTKKEIKRIEQIVEQQKRFGQEHNYVTAASKQKQIERLKATLVAPEKDEAAIHFGLKAKEGGGNDVIICERLKKSYDHEVFRNVELLVKKGERVFLLGANGCGKTTLLRLITGREQPDSGVVRLGAGIKAGYYEQTTESLHDELTVIEEMREAYPRMYDTEIRKALGCFLFRGDDISKRVGGLSGGERARIQLLKLMLSQNNLLLLDEPTNHLDITGREALEDALDGYGGTMLIVTHDRYLVNRLADRIIYMTRDGVREYIGGYDDFLEDFTLDQQERERRERRDKPNAYREMKEKQAQENRRAGEIKRLEAAIAEAEDAIAAIEARMALPDIAADYVEAQKLSDKADAKRAELDGLYERWSELQE